MVMTIAVDDAKRLDALRRYAILDTPPEPAFDDLAILAARVCGVPKGLISFLDSDRMWVKALVGLGPRELPLEESISALTAMRGEPVVIHDALSDPQLRERELVTVYGVRFYAGVPLTTPDGYVIGALSVVDQVPHFPSEEQMDSLLRIAHQVMTRLELRRQTIELAKANAELEREVKRRMAVEADLRDRSATLEAALEAADELMGCPDVDTLYRRAVELLRSKMGLERVGLFLIEGDRLRGTYGTDMQGNTTVEQDIVFRPELAVDEHLGRMILTGRRWVAINGSTPDVTTHDPEGVGRPWVVATPIHAGSTRIGILYNDTAITKAPLNEGQQDAVAVFCSFLGAAVREKEAEAARSQSEERFRGLVEHGSDIVTVMEPSGKFAFASPSVQRILGYMPDELLGLEAFTLIHPDDVGHVRSVFQHRLQHPGVGEPTRFRFRTKDGSWKHLEAIGTNPGARARVSGLVIVARDVTARVETEKALERRDAILAAVSSFAQQVLRGASWRAQIEEALRALVEAAEVTRAYLFECVAPSRSLVVVRHEWVAPGHEPIAQQVMHGGVSLHAVGLGRWLERLRAGDIIAGNLSEFSRREQPVLRALALKSIVVVPVRVGLDLWGFIGFGECRNEREWSSAEVDALQTVGSTLGAAIEREAMEKKLETTMSELARSNAELEQFAYVASHDLQEPLRMIQSYLRLVQRRYEGRLDTSAEEFIAYALDGAQRMRHLIQDLLAISRVGTRKPEPAPTDTAAVVSQVLGDLAEAVRESGAQITVGQLPTVMADGSQLAQVFQNLVSNAIKFRGERPCRIHIMAKQNEGEWVFSVSDTGIGIPPQHAMRIFAPFQRLHSRNEYPGNGIGLTLCKKIVERHGGRIWVESTPGEGSTFFFTIPEAEKPEGPSDRAENGAIRAAVSTKRAITAAHCPTVQ